jgi:hypothetical protein
MNSGGFLSFHGVIHMFRWIPTTCFGSGSILSECISGSDFPKLPDPVPESGSDPNNR